VAQADYRTDTSTATNGRRSLGAKPMTAWVTGTYGELRSDEFWRKRLAKNGEAEPAVVEESLAAPVAPEWWEASPSASRIVDKLKKTSKVPT